MTPTEKTAREELVFTPQYPARIRMTIYLYPIGILACLFFFYMAFSEGSFLPYGIYALIFGFTVFSMPVVIFREVRFDTEIIVKRYFLPQRRIEYEDVTDLTPRGLVAKRGGIPLVNVQNRAEFDKIIKHLAAQHKIKLNK
jgi:hypothetical protein